MTAGELIPALALVTLGAVLATLVARYIKIDNKIDD